MKKISIIGLKGSGKTCFMSAMTISMSRGLKMNNGRVFTITADDPAQIAPLMNAYEGMINNRRWPDSDDQIHHYDFNSSIALLPIMSFSLTDYPGGWLTDEVLIQEVTDEFEDSDAVVLLVDAERLKKGVCDVDTVKLNALFNKLAMDYVQKGVSFPPTMVVVSKSDLLDNEQEIQSVDEYLKQSFASIFGAETKILSGITHVKLGKNLKNDNKQILGDLDLRPEAGNLAIPILFAYYATTFTERKKLEDKMILAGKTIEEKKAILADIQNSNFIKRILSKVKGEVSNANDAIEDSTRELKIDEEAKARLCEVIETIEPTLLQNAEIYYDGELINKTDQL